MAAFSGSWTRLALSARLQRSSQILSVSGSAAYIFGGELIARQPVDSQLDTLDLGEADAQAKTIQAPSLAPSPRVGTASAVLDGAVYLFSGRGGIAMDAIDESGSVWSYSPTSTQWSLIKPQPGSHPIARSYHAMTSDGASTLFLHAGCPAKGRLSDLWSFDVTSRVWTELPEAPSPPRGGTSIAFCRGKLYRMGGFDGTTEQGGKLDVYDPTEKKWASVTYAPDGHEGPEARSVATLLAIKTSSGRDILVTMFGERDPSSLGHAGAGKMLADVWAFDLEQQVWSKVETDGQDGLPAARGWFDADTLKQAGGDAIIVHGGLAEDNSRLGDVWRLDIKD
ncbi:kelch domain-containing protein [Dactylonectria macrodidyma]|uniref:Kelch domain-containing protein n=1 Tax=Dactylonectria macrodidyma TaxID=307937 RepID=A0A9P9EA99_9HYPO|nr:kelch domain-containing protein [Dactylonectria macrodidyma]